MGWDHLSETCGLEAWITGAGYVKVCGLCWDMLPWRALGSHVLFFTVTSFTWVFAFNLFGHWVSGTACTRQGAGKSVLQCVLSCSSILLQRCVRSDVEWGVSDH